MNRSACESLRIPAEGYDLIREMHATTGVSRSRIATLLITVGYAHVVEGKHRDSLTDSVKSILRSETALRKPARNRK